MKFSCLKLVFASLSMLVSASLWAQQVHRSAGAPAHCPLAMTPLAKAVQANNIPKVRAFLSQHVRIDARFGETCETALFEARTAEMAQVLIQEGHASIDAMNSEGENILYRSAVQQRDIRLIRYLVKDGSNVNLPCGQVGFEERVIHPVVRSENLEVLKVLLFESKIKVDPNVLSYTGWSPMHEILAGHGDSNKDQQAITWLIKAGAKTELPTNDGRSPLWLALAFNLPNSARTLILNGADVNAVVDGDPMLVLAAQYTMDPSVMELMASRVKDINQTTRDNITALNIVYGKKDAISMRKAQILRSHGGCTTPEIEYDNCPPQQ